MVSMYVSSDDAAVCTACSDEAAPLSVRLHITRPSVLDPFLPQEPGFAQCVCMPNVVVLYLLNRPVAIVRATSMDQVALDGWLDRIRARPPRVSAAAQCA
jgi:hypothetical protein